MKMTFSLIKALTTRNIKLYFKDRITFFMSLITPLILFMLFVLFLKRVYALTLDGIIMSFGNLAVSAENREIFVGTWFLSSILATSAITISFCSATLIVQDKLNRVNQDLAVTPLKSWHQKLAYLLATFFSTAIIMMIVILIGFVYLLALGWTLSFVDVLVLILMTLALTFIGSLLACFVFSFVKTQGGISGISTMVSSLYGFISGAYMPLSQYPQAIRSVLGFNPGLYANIIIKNSLMGGILRRMQTSGEITLEAAEAIRDAFDLNYYFFNHSVSLTACTIVVVATLIVCLAGYLCLALIKKKKEA